MFLLLTTIENCNKSVEKIHSITGKSKEVILSDFSILSRKINRNISAGASNAVLSETLQYSSEKIYNCLLLSEIFYTELCYCRRAIDFIQLICHRYAEEEKEADGDNDYDYVETETLPLTKKDLGQYRATKLSEQLLVGSELLNKRVHLFSQRFVDGWSDIVRRFQNSIESLETTSPSATHGQLRDDFQELFLIASDVWNIMSLLASCNLFRLTQGSIYEMEPIFPNGSIFDPK